MSKLHVGIICGGVSYEHDISLQSATNIFHIIDHNRFKVEIILINKDGIWYRKNISEKIILSNSLKNYVLNFFQYLKNKYHGNISRYVLNNFVYYKDNYDILSKIDIAFPIIHGVGGEDGTLQGLLSMRNIPFVGTGVLGSAISMDKDVTKRLLRDFGLMVAPFITLNCVSDVLNMNFEYCVDVLGLPLFVKPVNQGSSIGVSRVTNSKSFYYAVDLAFRFSHKVLIESEIIGRELECAVLGNQDPEISVCGEIVLDNTFYTYRKKYFSSKSVKIVIPAQISSSMNNKIRSVVLSAFHALQCCGMARVDFFLTSDNRVVVNEVNTLPGFTAYSMFLKLWEATGLSSKELISMLIDLGVEKYRESKIYY